MNGDIGQKLDEILQNPQMLMQIKALADTMTGGKPSPPPTPAEEPKNEITPPPAAEPALSDALTLFSPSPTLSRNLEHTTALLMALKPFLDEKRCGKVDRMLSMMRLAQMATRFGGLMP